MPHLDEQMYCSQQINIPPTFPYILKKFAKAAIKTQPYDLLRWSSDYFRALAEDRVPPVKLRLEYPIYNTEGGLSCGYLRLLIKQFGDEKSVGRVYIEARWRGICLRPAELKRILCLAGCLLSSDVDVLKFVVVAAAYLTKSLTQTMILVCELLTKEPDGGNAGIAVDDFIYMYKYVAPLDVSKDIKYINGVMEGPELDVTDDDKAQPRLTGDSDRTSATEASSKEIQILHDETDVASEQVTPSTPPGVVMQFNPLLGARIPVEGGVTSKALINASKPPRDTYSKTPEEVRAEKKSKKYLDLKFVPSDLEETVGKMSGDGGQDEGGVNRRKADEKGTVPETGDGGPEEAITLKVYNEEEKLIETLSTMDMNKPESQSLGDDVDSEEVDGEETQADYPMGEEEIEFGDGEEGEGEISFRKSGKKMKGKEYSDYITDVVKKQQHKRIEEFQKEVVSIQNLIEQTNMKQYDLEVLAGRQMSTSSGEFIAVKIRDEVFETVADIIENIPWPEPPRKLDPDAQEIVETILDDYFTAALAQIIVEEELLKDEALIEQTVMVHAVLGIGPAVDEDTMNEFVTYAQEMGDKQHGIFMPRNIRHFLCPPLENYRRSS